MKRKAHDHDFGQHQKRADSVVCVVCGFTLTKHSIAKFVHDPCSMQFSEKQKQQLRVVIMEEK